MKPKQKLLNADFLIRPSRRNDNWGRDIIEAMSTGKLIISNGKDSLFITHKINCIVTYKWYSEYLVHFIFLYLQNNVNLCSIKKIDFEFAI